MVLPLIYQLDTAGIYLEDCFLVLSFKYSFCFQYIIFYVIQGKVGLPTINKRLGFKSDYLPISSNGEVSHEKNYHQSQQHNLLL